MDPPSYGRGPGGEIWKLEDNVYDLITLTEQVLSNDPLFFAINSYTEGLSPAVMEYIVKTTLCPVKGGHTHCDEIGRRRRALRRNRHLGEINHAERRTYDQCSGHPFPL